MWRSTSYLSGAAEPYRYVSAVGTADPHAYVYVWRDKFNLVRRSIFHWRSAGPQMWLMHTTGLAVTLIYLLFVPTTQVVDFFQRATARGQDRAIIADRQRIESDPTDPWMPTGQSWAAEHARTTALALEADADFAWGRYISAPTGPVESWRPKSATARIVELPPPKGAVSSTRLEFSAETDDHQTPVGVMLTETIYQPSDEKRPDATLQFDKSVAARLLQFVATAESSWTPAPTLATAKQFAGHRNRQYETEVRIAVLNDCSRSYRLTLYWPIGRQVKQTRQLRELLSSFRIRVPELRSPR